MIRPHYVGLYQSVCTSEKVAALKGHGPRVFFYQLLTHVDSWGRTEASAATLLGLVWPLLGETIKSTEAAIQDLARVGLVRLYEVGGKRFLQVEQWERFGAKVGRPDKRGDSLWPEPPPSDGRTSPEKDGLDRPRARVGSDRIGSDRLGSEEEGSGEEERPPKVEVEAWAKVFAEFPALDVPDCHAAYRDLLAMRKRKRFGEWEDATLRQNLKAALSYGPVALAAAMRESARHEYRGMFPEKHTRSGGASGEPTGLAAVEAMMRRRA